MRRRVHPLINDETEQDEDEDHENLENNPFLVADSEDEGDDDQDGEAIMLNDHKNTKHTQQPAFSTSSYFNHRFGQDEDFEDEDDTVEFPKSNGGSPKNNDKSSFEIVEADEDDDRYKVKEDISAAFSATNHGNKDDGRKHHPGSIKGRGAGVHLQSTMKDPLDDEHDEEDDDEVVDFVGLDDEAAAVVGISELPGGGNFMDPELEKRVAQMAELLKQYKTKTKTLRDKHSKMVEEVSTLRTKVEKLEEEKEEAELKAERGLRMIQYKNIGAAGNAGGGMRNLASDLEAQRKRDEARRQMYSNADQGEEEELDLGFLDTTSNLGYFKRLYQKFTIIVRKHFPLNRDLKRIDARFGNSVASYFFFFRWMIMNYLVLSVFCIYFLIKHILALFSFQTMSDVDKATRYNSANEPFTYYDWQSGDWARLSSFLPKFLMPSSFNPGDTATIYFQDNLVPGIPIYNATGQEIPPTFYDPSAEMGERMSYVSILIGCNLIILLSSIFKWIREDRKAKAFGLFEELDRQNRFAQVSLNVWDHSLYSSNEVEDLKHSVLDQYFLMVTELDTANKLESRSFAQKLVLFLRRCLSNLIYLGIQSSSAVAIVYLTATSSQMSQQVLQYVESNQSLKWLFPLVTLLSGSIVPIAVSIINAMLPTIATVLTKFEKWDDGGFYTKLMLFRLFVAKILNALIQVFSFMQLLDPYLLRGNPTEPFISADFDRQTRANTEKAFVSAGSSYLDGAPNGLDECRADGYGAGIFQLVVTEFVISKVGFFMGPAIQYLVAKIRKKPFDRPEFHVAKHMVNLLFFQTLCFMSFPFFPFGTIFICVMMFLGFKLEKKVLEKFMAKPKQAWSAKDAANFFIKFFFVTFAISLALISYVLSNETFPKACTLLEHLTTSKFPNGPNPLETCYINSQSGQSECFLTGRTVDQISTSAGRKGLEELRFWEEVFVARNDTLTPESSLQTETLLRTLTGFSDSSAVSYPSLLVCSLSCGPFIYSTNFYVPLDSYLSEHLSTIYLLSTQSPFFIWGIAILIMMRYLFTKNTIRVLNDLQQEKEIALRNLVANLEAKIRKLTNKVEKMKQT